MKLKALALSLMIIATAIVFHQIPEDKDLQEPTIKIANWNIQTFGKSKWSNPPIKEKILSEIKNYDIIFIQEVRDISQTTPKELCKNLTKDYNCDISQRAGRTQSKEQYLILYKKDINLTNKFDFNTQVNANEFWERPPIKVNFKVDNYEFTAYNIHTKPTDVTNELTHLSSVVISNSTENIIILGDLNADGAYYNENKKHVFQDFNWIVKDSDDTTVAKSDNTYDRIILNNEMFEEYKGYGIYKNINESVSDHYIVWIEVSTKEVN